MSKEGNKKTAAARIYSGSFVEEYGTIEILRSERYHRYFSVILSKLEWADADIHDKKKKEVLKNVIDIISGSSRNCDVVGMGVDDRFITVLPETDYLGSLITIRKMRRAVDVMAKEYPQVSVNFAQSTYPSDGKSYTDLLGAAEKRISGQKSGLWAKFGIKDKLFWQAVSILLQNKYDDGNVASTFDVGADMEFPPVFISLLQETVLREIIRHPSKKGILYMGLGNISPDSIMLKTISNMPKTMTKVFIVGGGESDKLNIVNATHIYVSDDRLLDTFFILFIREDTAYVVVCRERWGGTFSCFHSVDPYLAEGLIEKFQRDYYLQEQL
ncbi:MAG: hypothetical protein A2073_02860 [Deltaproteobacteria bacterium GWC2_42_11]|nr:MAG: hypothetical protein A2073_02860 [Deltaproteobacteria bacterium GWC2_42_11]HBO85140.1 hypothetical protein [Deltaproteobacteria bacterium]